MQDALLRPLLRAHNIALDPTVYLVVYFFSRGAFYFDVRALSHVPSPSHPRLQSLADLLKSENAELKIREEMKEEPVYVALPSHYYPRLTLSRSFLQSNNGGRNLIVGQPSSARALSNSVHALAQAAGLEDGHMMNIRRDAANDVCHLSLSLRSVVDVRSL
jgi:hypothetical protein